MKQALAFGLGHDTYGVLKVFIIIINIERSNAPTNLVIIQC